MYNIWFPANVLGRTYEANKQPLSILLGRIPLPNVSTYVFVNLCFEFYSGSSTSCVKIDKNALSHTRIVRCVVSMPLVSSWCNAFHFNSTFAFLQTLPRSHISTMQVSRVTFTRSYPLLQTQFSLQNPEASSKMLWKGASNFRQSEIARRAQTDQSTRGTCPA